MTKANECRNFVIAGHAGSGKTTLCELMLSKSGVIPRPGSIEAKNTVSDFMADEQARQAGIYSSCLNCTWKENQFFFTDTPGYGEFIGEYVAAALAVFAVCEALTASADNMFVSYAFNIVLFALYAAYLVRRERIDLGAMLRAFLHR